MMNTNNEKKFLSYKDLSQYLNVPIGTLYFWVNQKQIPHIRLGARCVRFDLSEIQNWIISNTAMMTKAANE